MIPARLRLAGINPKEKFLVTSKPVARNLIFAKPDSYTSVAVANWPRKRMSFSK